MTNLTSAGHVESPDAAERIRHGGTISLKSTESSQSTPELRDPEVDGAWDLNSLHVFQQPRRIPKIIEAHVHVQHERRPVRDEASTVTKGDLTMSSSTSRSHTLRSIAEEQERSYATDNADEGVAPSSKTCMDRICITKLAPSWRRRGAHGASVKRRSSLKSLMKLKRDPDYESVVDVTDFQKRDAAASTQSETESRTSNNVESEQIIQEKYSNNPLADKYPDPTSDSRAWEDFSGGSRCWFQSCKLWPLQEDGVIPQVQRRDRTTEIRDEPASNKALTETSAKSVDVPVGSRALQVFPRTTPFIVKEKERLTTFDERPLAVRQDGPASPARSQQSSSSASTQGSSYFIIDKKDYQLASSDLPVPRTVASLYIQSDDDDDDTAFILEVGLD
jgi:hypothetical protein